MKDWGEKSIRKTRVEGRGETKGEDNLKNIYIYIKEGKGAYQETVIINATLLWRTISLWNS